MMMMMILLSFFFVISVNKNDDTNCHGVYFYACVYCIENYGIGMRSREFFFIVGFVFLVCVIVPHKELVSSTFSRFIGHRHRNVENMCAYLCVREKQKKCASEREANCVND